MKCIKGYTVEVMSSPAGYYLGTRDPAASQTAGSVVIASQKN